ncbi:MAG: ATP-dependent helicase [Anaerococcus vaginalis]|uniref:ATP-dependent helicase n=1 Tax=Anaerococcus vaginalis TaxID=33037 RepID=UPI00290E682A|nr:ATP-dependent helicase [Anaerococcus vaginalis]MDU4447121.1 ATP-dependent helicase [Anaerococcus vaginalis]MDU6181640.1 ATP-dependent helicase [Anaerococcus vaginalis]MDU7432245.1 ATP-dependent helicase [Anaerococcus vaginalis]
MKFTSKQLQAAKHLDGPLLVLAIPGSGKTTMLLERIKFLSEHIDSSKILNLTFSRIQANDMKKRFDSKDSNFMTIHAFCYLIIRNYLKKYNRQVNLIEDEKIYNKFNLVGEIYKNINKKKMSKEDLNLFFQKVSFMKNSLLDISYLKKVEISNAEKIYLEYEKIKKQKHLLDFDDMQVYALELLNDESLLRSIKNKYKYFQLDEGQDTSLLQFKILEKIVYPENNLLVVADDDQSIYSFRASDPTYLLNFTKIYKDAKIMTLDTNYRSGKEIIKLASTFIKQNKNRYKKDFKVNRKNPSQIKIKSFKNFSKEYAYILENIDKNENTGILFRNNISAISLISYLLENNIDFSINSKIMDFFESKIFLDMINIINFSNDFNDVEIFSEIYYKISSYLSKDDIEKLIYKPVNENIFDFFENSDIEDFKKDALFNIEKKLNHLRKLDIDKKISFIYQSLSYKDYIDMLSRKYKEETVNKDIYIESLKYFTKSCENLDQVYEKIKIIEKKSKSLSENNLKLSTIHSSKGLEYDTVFVIDLIKNEFPIILDKENYFERLEEERRIFYVGLTRARDSLYILTLKNRNNKKVYPSKFYTTSLDILKNKP